MWLCSLVPHRPRLWSHHCLLQQSTLLKKREYTCTHSFSLCSHTHNLLRIIVAFIMRLHFDLGSFPTLSRICEASQFLRLPAGEVVIVRLFLHTRISTNCGSISRNKLVTVNTKTKGIGKHIVRLNWELCKHVQQQMFFWCKYHRLNKVNQLHTEHFSMENQK